MSNPIIAETPPSGKPADALQTMRQARRWLLWKAVDHEDPSKSARKVPYYADGGRRSKTDTEEDRGRLVTYEEARKKLNGTYTGLGFALGPDEAGGHWQGIDFDWKDPAPALQDRQEKIRAFVDQLPGYVELSPSGKGVHAIGYGPAFESTNQNGVEFYSTGRFFTVTEKIVRDGELTDLTPFIESTLKPFVDASAIGKARKKRNAPRQRPEGLEELDAAPMDLASWRETLFAINPDVGYLDWFHCICAVHFETGGSEQGLALVEEWSAQGKKSEENKEGQIQRIWDGLDDAREDPGDGLDDAREDPVTGASLIKLAREHGWQGTWDGGRRAPNNDGTPDGFRLSPDGVFLENERGEVRITYAPCGVTAFSRDQQAENWGRLVWWQDQDGDRHERAVRAALFHQPHHELASALADGGLRIVPGQERNLIRFLTAFSCPDRLLSSPATGWVGEAFVLPGETLNEPQGQRIVFQPAGLSNVNHTIRRQGSFEAWKAALADFPPTPTFVVCASLSAAIRHRCNGEGGGFHLCGQTSMGKTTALQAAASVWGSGVDPQRDGGREAYILRWNATDNALEAVAEAHNDLPLIIDEIGEATMKDFGKTIYRVVSGTGRGRAKRDGGLAVAKSWRTTILSAGELGVSQYITEKGSTVRGGQLVRMVDIPHDHGFRSAAESDAVKEACARHYGHAGPALIESGDLTTGWTDFDFGSLGPAITPEAQRVRQRFAIVAHAGLLASRRGIVPWAEETVMEATRLAYEGWLDTSDGVSDSDRGILNIVAYLAKHGGSRFERGDQHSPVRDRAGWYREHHPEGAMYHFTPAAFREACAGADEGEVKRALRDQGVLHTNRKGKLTASLKVENQLTLVVSVKAAVLGYGSAPEVGPPGPVSELEELF